MACAMAGRRWRPEAAARARGGRASPAAGGGAERCGGGGRWPAVARVWIWCVNWGAVGCRRERERERERGRGGCAVFFG
jgi:hypothetical protein